MQTKSKLSQIRALQRDGKFGNVDSISAKKNGEIVFRRGYFYRDGMAEGKFMDSIDHQLKDAGIEFTMVDWGDHWAPFNGGATLARSSHFFVVIK
jgi:hypothetical protein